MIFRHGHQSIYYSKKKLANPVARYLIWVSLRAAQLTSRKLILLFTDGEPFKAPYGSPQKYN